MTDAQEFSLKWNNHSAAFTELVKDLYLNETYSDATLVCQRKFFPVHKIILSNCSPYFKFLFADTPCEHPCIVLSDVQSSEIELLLKFIYQGEVNALQADLPSLLDIAECLQIESLAHSEENDGNVYCTESLTHEKRTGKCSKRKSPNNINCNEKKKKLKETFDSIDIRCLEPDIIFNSEKNHPVKAELISSAGEDSSQCNEPVFPSEDSINEFELDQSQGPSPEAESLISKNSDSDFAPSKINGEFFCPKCPYRTAKYFNITRHIMRNHTGEKPYACNYCPYRTVDRTQLTNHIQRNHYGKEPFVCSECFFGSFDLSTLKRHMRIHKKEPSSSCSAMEELQVHPTS